MAYGFLFSHVEREVNGGGGVFLRSKNPVV